MAYSLENRLVIGVASSALFDLTESDAIFRAEGEIAYRTYQEANLDRPLAPGVAFSFIERLLSFNELASADDPLVEVIVLSRNDPDTGLRVMRSIEHHGLPVTRAIFMEGRSPYQFIPALNVKLFLSANDGDVREALAQGYPAGTVLPSAMVSDPSKDLRIAFDFDGVLVDDTSEQVMQSAGLASFQEFEIENAVLPHNPGPMKDFLVGVSAIQQIEAGLKLADKNYRKRLHVSIVTARNAPAHERAIATLKAWGVMVNDAFFLGGIDKGKVLEVLRPHIFFDDQQGHLESASRVVPSVHVPFGQLNQLLPNATPPTNL
jgi:5'-nucleotidase